MFAVSAGRVVGGVTTTSLGNVSLFAGEPEATVLARRHTASATLGIGDPWWTCRAVHGAAVSDGSAADADALLLREGGAPGAVLGADCALVLVNGTSGAAVVHAGWRGVVGGVLEAAVAALRERSAVGDAWIGPCIGPDSFEVGPDVAALFPAVHHAETAWGTRSVDVPAAVAARLAACGVEASWCGIDTFTDTRFFSHRRGARGRHAVVAQVRGA